MTATSAQFTDPRLVAAYDTLNALGDDSDFFYQLVSILSARTIVDLGCGTGLLTCELAKRGHSMIGIEPAGSMLDIARSKPYGNQVQWIEGSYEKFNGLRADMVLMTSHVAQFFLNDNEWFAMLKASHGVLRPGGHIVFDSRTPIFPPYQTWPTEKAPRRVGNPTVGPIDWWFKLIEIKGNLVYYELHYLFINSGEKITSVDKLIFRSRDELATSLEDAGFHVQTVYGDWDASLATATSPEMIFVAVRK